MRARYRVLSAFLTVVMAFLALGCGYVEHNSLVKADASDLLSSKDRRPFEQVYEEYLLMMEQFPARFAVEAAGRIQNAKAAMEVATKQIPILQCLQRSFHAGSAQEMAIQNVLNVFLEVTWTQTIS